IMTNRTVIMPSTGDPFLLAMWVDFYKRIWRSEVDRTVVLLNTDQLTDYPEVVTYCEKLLAEAGIEYIICPKRVNHGPALDMLLSYIADSNPLEVGIMEEDAFVFGKGAVQDCFSLLSTNDFDIVASRRGSCSQWLIELGKSLWGTEDHGPNFWPNFYFGHYRDLVSTDRNFGARTWQPGEVVFADSKMVVVRRCAAALHNSLNHGTAQCLYQTCNCPDVVKEHKVSYTSPTNE